jgi:uncharacterized membrane protein
LKGYKLKILKLSLKILLTVFFVAAGINHFRAPEFYLKIIPPYLPWHAALNYISGACEIILGIMLLIPRWTRLTAWGIIALLIAVFPANIYMAMNPQLFPDVKPIVSLIRLPFQALFIAWAYWFTRPEKPTDKPVTTT